MKKQIIALTSGLLFGVGLNISQMTDPQKVLSFLTLLPGWDPSLAFVMASALAVSGLGYAFVSKLSKPVFDSDFHLPTQRQIDRPLIVGATLFGIGWGLAGLCPGPAIASLSHASPKLLYFVVAMSVGMIVASIIKSKQ